MRFRPGSAVIASVLGVTCLTVVWSPAFASDVDSASPGVLLMSAPLRFEPNVGQAEASVQFISRGDGPPLLLKGREIVILVEERASKNGFTPVTLRLGASRRVSIGGEDRLPSQTHFFLGNDSKRWRTNVPNYAKVRYRNVYPGIDLVFHGTRKQLEFDFIVSPGANPNVIRLEVEGAETALDGEDLVLRTQGSEVRLRKPVSYQNGRARPIPSSFVLSRRQIRFQLGAYDRSEPLVIDPTLVYSTYIGGVDIDYGRGITVDSSGNAYIVGQAKDATFPTTTGSYQASFAGPNDAWVAKFSPTGTLLFSTFLGGPGFEDGRGIAVDSSGVYVVGYSVSGNFPITAGVFDPTRGPSATQTHEGFAAKLSLDGSTLIYSTFLGGSGGFPERAHGVTVDASGNAIVVGITDSVDFPTTPGALSRCACTTPSIPPGTTCTCDNPNQNGFVVKLNPTATGAVYSTYLGGFASDQAFAVAVDPQGNAYITGSTMSGNFPATIDAYPPQCTADASSLWFCGSHEVFLTKLSSMGALLYSTHFGGPPTTTVAHDYGYAVAADSSGNAYLTGSTTSPSFPTTAGAFDSTCNGSCNDPDAFVVKINTNATGAASLVYSTYLGTPFRENGYGIAVDSSGNAFVAGEADGDAASGFPRINAFQRPCTTCGSDIFVSQFSPTGTLLFSTTTGGGASREDIAYDIALDASGKVHLTGETESNTGFPLQNAYDSTCNCATQLEDSFVMVFAIGSSVKGDANGDTVLTISDVVYVINFLFGGGTAPVGSADVNGDGAVNIGDVFYLINHLFSGGPQPV